MTSSTTQELTRATGESIDRLTQAAGNALDKAHATADKALSSVQAEAQDWAQQAQGPLEDVLAKVKELGSRGSALAADKARQAAEHTSNRIKQDPLKAMLIAVAAGAGLAMVAGHLARRRQNDR
jgi:ElaB/YqjD/DUF883 family membrane-anchored ribosome-binding protein